MSKGQSLYAKAADGKTFKLYQSGEQDDAGQHSYNLVVDGNPVPVSMHFHEGSKPLTDARYVEL